MLEDMKKRLERGPHAALGVVEGASAPIARAAFLQLTKSYHPAKFAREPAEIVRQANEVFLSLRAAYETLVPPIRKAAARSSSGFKPLEDTPTRGRAADPSPAEPGVARAGSQLPGPGRDVVTMRNPAPGARRPDDTPSRDAPAGRDPRSRPPTPPPPAPGSYSQRIKTPTPAPPLGKPATGPSAVAPPKAAAATSMAPLSADDGGHSAEENQLGQAMVLLRRKQWSEARKLIHALAVKVPAEKKYRALLAYARGREAQDSGRHDEARTEFTRALALDPELQMAKAAMAQVAEEPAERPSGGLFSKLFKKP